MSGPGLQHLAPSLRVRSSSNNNMAPLSSFHHSPSSPLPPAQFASDFDAASYQAAYAVNVGVNVNGLSSPDAMPPHHQQFSSRPNNSNTNKNAFVHQSSPPSSSHHVQFQTPTHPPHHHRRQHMHYQSPQQPARRNSHHNSNSLDPDDNDGASPTSSSLAGHTLHSKAQQYFNADLSRQFPGIADEHHDAYMVLHESDMDMNGAAAGAGANPMASPTSPSSPSLRKDDGTATTPGTAATSSHLLSSPPSSSSMNLIAHPPHLAEWRALLFDVAEPLTLSEAEFHTYFPHVDNVYSHRSTQKYKRKPFVSHYWDCRLKGRPPGTPKSDDPNKRKRQRTTRDRDLCDVKIKITEYFATNGTGMAGNMGMGMGMGMSMGNALDGAEADDLSGVGGTGLHGQGLFAQQQHQQHLHQMHQQPPPLTFIMEHADKDARSPGAGAASAQTTNHAPYMPDAAFGVLAPSSFPPGHPGAHGAKYYTIQRVNGNAAGGTSAKDGGGGDDDEGGGVAGLTAGMHKHTLADSDRIKKNSVQRWLLKQEKERKKSGVQTTLTPTASSTTAGDSANPAITNTNPHPLSPSLSIATATSISSPYTPLSAALASGPARVTALNHSSTAHNNGNSSSNSSNSAANANANTLTLFGNAFCPFTQRVWIALELKAIPYTYVEVVPKHMLGIGANTNGNTNGSNNNNNNHHSAGMLALPEPPPLPHELLELNPDGVVPCIRHGNWAAWESGVLMEYLEDLEPGDGRAGPGGRSTNLLPVGNPRLRAHCRLWTDHINRKILPAFYALLLTPPATTSPSPSSPSSPPISDAERHARLAQSSVLAERLQTGITALVNASHATGPFFLGNDMSFVDVAFAPWIIRLSRVLERYRAFPKPEVGSRWMAMVDAIERDERVRATVSDERAYHNVYRTVAERGVPRREGLRPGDEAAAAEELRLLQHQHLHHPRQPHHHVVYGKLFAEMEYAKKVVREEGFGLGGDVWGLLDTDAAVRMP